MDYLENIEKVYSGAASKENTGFPGKAFDEEVDYSVPMGQARIIELLREKGYTKIHIDENCIVGWATEFYKASPSYRKEEFIGDDTGLHKTIGEIREPKVFRDYIHPYTGKTNVKFQYLMDRLNDTLQKKNLGAFYTPELYAEKSHELLRMAIARVPEGNDYIILDRCAGTGNLEKGLTDEELSHCILSTVEYYEYKVLQELLGAKVRHIIPPVEAPDTYHAGLVLGADALSEGYVKNPLITQYVENQQCTVILYENPPYAETTSIEHQKKKAGTVSSSWKKSYVFGEMRKDKAVSGSALNELGNAFIWSAFKYYLRQPTDSYVVFSPPKYWKAQHLISKEFLDGFAFNRRHFHTKIYACIMVALWTNKPSTAEDLAIHAYDIKDDVLEDWGMVDVKRIHSIYSSVFYDRRKFPSDVKGGVVVEFDGTEARPGRTSVRLSPVYNPNILGYLVVKGANFDNPDSCVHLTTAGAYDANGFYLRNDNYLEKLPMFCASRYITYNRAWTERSRIMKSADGATEFNADVASGHLEQWLLKCLLFTCLEMQNHMRTFAGSDGRLYRNELCLDTTNGDTVASTDIAKLKTDGAEDQLLGQWEILLEAAKAAKEYNTDLTYGVYQISLEVDTSYEDADGHTVWNNPAVHAALGTLKTLVKEYYNREIVPTLFKYEFLK